MQSRRTSDASRDPTSAVDAGNTVEQAIRMYAMTAQRAENNESRQPPALEVVGVSKSFGGLVVLDGLTFELERGAMTCILGPNGCGKTTLFNLITGALPPDDGEIRIRGVSVGGLPPHLISRKGVVRKFQVPGIYPELTVAENLEVPLVAGGPGNGPIRLLFGGAGAKANAERRNELLELCGLSRKFDTPVANLAHGERQRLEIAMLLARDSDLLLLDEPTAGMSAAETRAVAELVVRLRDEHGKAVLVIEHDMAFVRELGCPIIVMVRGRVIASGSYQTVSRDPAVIASYLGKAR
ncbi:MAG: ABC transporter ATP-binding protein [Rhizobiaceae bacterium]|nr:ABC transporter ATP-binding protein [Rhizobiaceae bacterium]